MNTKEVGDIAEAKVLSDLLARGHKVLIPWGDNLPYDLVVDNNGQFIRIQVKNGLYEDGVIKVRVCHTLSYRNKSNEVKDYHGEVEWIATYCSALNEIFYLPIQECGNSAVYLRIEEPKVVVNTIKWAKDYKEFIGVSSNG